MKLKLKTIEECNALIAQANKLLGYPNYENETLTYTEVPEQTEVKDEQGIVIESYYELEVSSEMLEQMMLIATEKLVHSEVTTDFEPEKRFEVKATNKQFNDLVFAVPNLLLYVKDKGLMIYEEGDYRIFYTNEFVAGHRPILETYLGVESITDRNGNT